MSKKVKSEDCGSKAINKLLLAIKSQYPYLKGFNRTGLYRMIQFYETYRDNIIVSQLVTQLSWTNNLLILQGTKTIEEKEFYIRLCIKNNYSVLDGIVIDKKTTDEPTKFHVPVAAFLLN